MTNQMSELLRAVEDVVDVVKTINPTLDDTQAVLPEDDAASYFLLDDALRRLVNAW